MARRVTSITKGFAENASWGVVLRSLVLSDVPVVGAENAHEFTDEQRLRAIFDKNAIAQDLAGVGWDAAQWAIKRSLLVDSTNQSLARVTSKTVKNAARAAGTRKVSMEAAARGMKTALGTTTRTTMGAARVTTKMSAQAGQRVSTKLAMRMAKSVGGLFAIFDIASLAIDLFWDPYNLQKFMDADTMDLVYEAAGELDRATVKARKLEPHGEVLPVVNPLDLSASTGELTDAEVERLQVGVWDAMREMGFMGVANCQPQLDASGEFIPGTCEISEANDPVSAGEINKVFRDITRSTSGAVVNEFSTARTIDPAAAPSTSSGAGGDNDLFIGGALLAVVAGLVMLL